MILPTTSGWITEVIAGMINENEAAEDAVIRETLEDTGYKIKNPLLIRKFFSSPGGTSEHALINLRIGGLANADYGYAADKLRPRAS